MSSLAKLTSAFVTLISASFPILNLDFALCSSFPFDKKNWFKTFIFVYRVKNCNIYVSYSFYFLFGIIFRDIFKSRIDFEQ